MIAMMTLASSNCSLALCHLSCVLVVYVSFNYSLLCRFLFALNELLISQVVYSINKFNSILDQFELPAGWVVMAIEEFLARRTPCEGRACRI